MFCCFWFVQVDEEEAIRIQSSIIDGTIRIDLTEEEQVPNPEQSDGDLARAIVINLADEDSDEEESDDESETISFSIPTKEEREQLAAAIAASVCVHRKKCFP